MISYLLSNGKSGNILNPQALRVFYSRLYYGKKQRYKKPHGWWWDKVTRWAATKIR